MVNAQCGTLIDQPVRIYVGNKLLAEYRHAEDKTYFYQQDQINSTRIVTDETGTVVYSAAHDPYGGIQQTWVNTFDPTPKFSGKERDGESGLDYFGARYYDRAQYRFISADPVIPVGKAVSNPQRWNLYTYCLSNPINNADVDGADAKNFLIEIWRHDYNFKFNAIYGNLYANGTEIGFTLEHLMNRIPANSYKGTLRQEGSAWIIELNYARIRVVGIGIVQTVTAVILDGDGLNVTDLHGCIYIGMYPAKDGKISGQVMEDLKNLIQKYQRDMNSATGRVMGFLGIACNVSGIDLLIASMGASDNMGNYLSLYYDMMATKIDVIIREAK